MMEKLEINETFEIISTFFVNEFYIKLYNTSLSFQKDGRVPSITAGYIKLLRIYTRTLEKNSLIYKKKVGNLFSEFAKFYRGMGDNHELTIGYCIDLIVREFIPSDYISSLNDKDKHILLREIIINIVKNIINNICNVHINNIIDLREDKEIIEILRDDILNCLFMERNRMQKQFILSENYGSDEKYRVMYNNLTKNVKLQLKKKIKIIVDLKGELDKYKKLYKVSIKQIFELRIKNTDLNKTIIDKDNNINNLISDNNLKNNKIREFQNNFSIKNFNYIKEKEGQEDPKILNNKNIKPKKKIFTNNKKVYNINNTFEDIFTSSLKEDNNFLEKEKIKDIEIEIEKKEIPDKRDMEFSNVIGGGDSLSNFLENNDKDNIF